MAWISKRKPHKWSLRSNGYKSQFELRIADQLAYLGCAFEYETLKIGYTKPARESRYTPDFVLPNGVIIEVKGDFDVDDRAKHLLVKAQHPEYDIRFVFGSSKRKIRKGSPTSYADWCRKHGFQFADKEIPINWITERPQDGRTTSDTLGQAHPPAPRKA